MKRGNTEIQKYRVKYRIIWRVDEMAISVKVGPNTEYETESTDIHCILIQKYRKNTEGNTKMKNEIKNYLKRRGNDGHLSESLAKH